MNIFPLAPLRLRSSFLAHGISFLLPWLILAAAQAGSDGQSSRRPPIEVRPEVYLGWSEDQPPPQPRRLTWPLVLTLTASDTNGQVVAGPMTVTAYEEIAGARFSLRGLRPAPQAPTPAEEGAASPNPPAQAGVFDVLTGAAITLQELELAAHVIQHGANSLRIRCFVRLHLKENADVRTYETITALECRPGRRALLAAFPGVMLHVTAAWSRESPYLLSE
jgi:hypothetical protein